MPRPLHESARYRGHDFPPVRNFLDHLLRYVPYPLWPGRLARRLRLQGKVGVGRYEEPVPGLASALRVVFASDFHAGPITSPGHLRETVRLVEELRPDLLLLGGDFVSGRALWAEELIGGLGRLRPPAGTFAVLGNHDLWSDFDELEVMLLREGVELLTNRCARLPEPWQAVTLCGLDDHESGLPDAKKLRDAAGYRLLLVHSPSNLLDLDGERFDLALAGHTHGGQICLPGGRPLVLPRGETVRDFPYGRYGPGRAGSGTLIVSRGVGFSGLPLRLFAPPEVLEVRLVPGG